MNELATMKAKTGFKQTEVGLIPEDWEVKTIDEIADVNGGGTPSTTISEFWNGSINWFTPTEIGYSKYVNESKRKITHEGLNKSSAKILPKGTVLLTSRAGIGDIAILELESSTNQGFQSLTAKENTSNEFLYYLILISKEQLLKKASGSTFLEISPNNVKSIQIPLPPLDEQKAIATALSDVDALIQSLDALIAKKKAIKQGAMQELLTPPHSTSSGQAQKGGKRLDGFSGEWVEKKLGDLIHEFQNGFGFSAQGYREKGVPIITMAQIGLQGQFQLNTNKVNYWAKSELNHLKDFILNKGDLIMSMTDVTPNKNLIGRMTIIEKDGPFFLNQRVGHLRINKELVDPVILKHLSNMRQWRNYSKAIASLGVQSNIGTSDIKNGLFTLPSIQVQKAIAKILSDMDLEIESLERKKKKYEKIKQGMMQELLTGRVRIVNVEL